MADEIKRHFGYGFTMVDNNIFESKDFDKLIDKFVYMTLIKFSFGKSKSFPSISTLSAHCLSATKTVKRSLKRLENRAYIKKEQRLDEQGNHLSNVYHLYEIPRVKTTIGVGSNLPEGGVKTTPGVGSNLPTNNKNLEEDELKNIAEIISYLNAKAGTNYKSSSKKTQSYIHQRINEGFSVDDCKTVIEKKCKQWLNDPTMVQYLRPSTLFGAKHFEEYLNEVVKKGNGPDDRGTYNPAYKKNAWDQYK